MLATITALHGVLLVAEGMSCREAAKALGDSPGTVVNWVQRFEKRGFGGLSDGDRTGRPTRLGPKELEKIAVALRRSPADYGLPGPAVGWAAVVGFSPEAISSDPEGPAMPTALPPNGFRLRKPRPEIAQADPLLQAAVKKNSSDWQTTLTSTCGPWTKSTFSSMAVAAGCGFRRRSATPVLIHAPHP